MADNYHVPKGVSLETLFEILSGWSAVGAAAEPQYTADVEELTEIADAVRRQTRFLEDVGVLEPEGQKHRLTDRGEALASALAIDEPQRAREAAREVLSDWRLTDEIRGVVRENPVPEDELVDLVATLADEDVDSSRVRSGVSTLLELLEWADLLERDASGRYRLPDDAEPPPIETPEVPTPPRPDPRRTDLSSAVREPAESASPRAGPATSELTAAIEAGETKHPRPEPTHGDLTQAVDSDSSAVLDSEPSLEEDKSAAGAGEKSSSSESETVPVSAQATEESPLGGPETTEKRETDGEQPEGPTEAEAEATVEVEPTDEGPGAEEVITEGHPEPEATSEQTEPTEEKPETAESTSESTAEGPTESGEVEVEVDLSAADETDLTEVGERLSEAIADVDVDMEDSDGGLELDLESGPELEIDVGDDSGIEIRLDEESALDVEAIRNALDSDINIEAMTAESPENDDQLETDGGNAIDVTDDEDTELTIDEDDGGVSITIGDDPGVTIRVGGEEEAQGSEAADSEDEQAAQEAEEAAGAVEKTAEGVEETVEEAAEETTEGASETAEEAIESAEETTEEAVEETEEATEEVAEEAAGEAEEAAEEAAEEVEEAAETATETAGEEAAIALEQAEGTDLAEIESAFEDIAEAAREATEAEQALEEAAEAAREAAEAAREAAEEASANASEGDAGVSTAAEPHALSLGIDLDADSEDLEALVEGIRRGLLEGEES